MTGADARWLAAAACLAERARPLSRPNPAVGAIVVKDGIVLGRGWTHAGGRPHAEAIALGQAGEAARGATLYVTLEPCAHQSERGPACAGLTVSSGIARAVIGIEDPDPRTAGQGVERLKAAGVDATLADDPVCRDSLAGYLVRRREGRPFVTLKLAITADGFVARADGTSKWITGEIARAHAHRERARSDAILVGGRTLRIDEPRLDVRLPGLEERSPRRALLTRGDSVDGWETLQNPGDVHRLHGVNDLLVEGGSATATAFLSEDLVDRILIYRAPIIVGEGKSSFGYVGLDAVADAHGRWSLVDEQRLGVDRLEVYERVREG